MPEMYASKPSAIRDDESLTREDQDLAICIAALKICNRIANQTINAARTNLPKSEVCDLLGGLIVFLVDGFSDYAHMNGVIDRLAAHAGFRVEEHDVTMRTDLKM